MAQYTLILIGTTIAAVVVRALYQIVYNLFYSPLSQYPGPKTWAITRIPLTLATVSGRYHTKVLALHEKYGPVIRIGPHDLSYTTEPAWRDAWAHRQGHEEFSKSSKGNSSTGVPGILLADKPDHVRYRKLLSPAFSERGLREQEPRIQQYVNLLMQRLEECSKASEPAEMVTYFNWTTFDLIGDLAFGESFSCLEDARTHPWVQSVFTVITSVPLFDAIRSYGLSFLFPILIPRRMLQMRANSRGYAIAKIDARLKKGVDRGDFLDNVLKHGDPEKGGVDGSGMRIEELRSNAGTLVLAGSETTATLLSGATYYLIANPRVLEKVTKEVRTAFTNADDITITSTSQNCPYLVAMLTEALRIYPPVPSFSPRQVPNHQGSGGDTVDGVFLPADTHIRMEHYAVYNYSANFTRPREFLPERWLAPDHPDYLSSEFDADRKEVHQPFSIGPRNCIGRNLAYAEMRVILARLLWEFDLKMNASKMKGRENWADRQTTRILWEKGPLWVDLKRVN